MKTLNQSGFMLLETMVGLLLFSIGILGMVSMLVMATKASSEATYRSEASYLANQIIGQMWVDRSNLAAYQLNAAAPACFAGGSASGKQEVSDWLAEVAKLPGSATVKQQILLDPLTNFVTVTICWKAPNAPAHNFVATSAIN
ncbi:MAG: hypothetical protein PXX73_08595 [Sideroxydans sp.]|nr:hypothetical protein [Sideroxydans sp.]